MEIRHPHAFSKPNIESKELPKLLRGINKVGKFFRKASSSSNKTPPPSYHIQEINLECSEHLSSDQFAKALGIPVFDEDEDEANATINSSSSTWVQTLNRGTINTIDSVVILNQGGGYVQKRRPSIIDGELFKPPQKNGDVHCHSAPVKTSLLQEKDGDIDYFSLLESYSMTSQPPEKPSPTTSMDSETTLSNRSSFTSLLSPSISFPVCSSPISYTQPPVEGRRSSLNSCYNNNEYFSSPIYGRRTSANSLNSGRDISARRTSFHATTYTDFRKNSLPFQNGRSSPPVTSPLQKYQMENDMKHSISSPSSPIPRCSAIKSPIPKRSSLSFHPTNAKHSSISFKINDISPASPPRSISPAKYYMESNAKETRKGRFTIVSQSFLDRKKLSLIDGE